MTKKIQRPKKNLLGQAAELIQTARSYVVRNTNSVMVFTYFYLRKLIVEDKQGGNYRAARYQEILKKLSQDLTKKFGKGFSVDNLENMRHFYLSFSKSETLSRIIKSSNQISGKNTNKSKSETLSRNIKQSINLKNSSLHFLYPGRIMFCFPGSKINMSGLSMK